jgi:hypothetical protein
MTSKMANVKMLCLFVLMLSATILVLLLLNWIPLAVRNDGIRKYASVEEVQKKLHLRKVYLPSYFPDYLQWPPFEIYAQSKPFTLLLMHVKEREKNRIVLAMRQVDARVSSPMRLRIEPTQINKQEQVTLKGHPAVLSWASCDDGTVCNTLAWQEDGYTLTLVARESVAELIRIAESMLAE